MEQTLKNIVKTVQNLFAKLDKHIRIYDQWNAWLDRMMDG